MIGLSVYLSYSYTRSAIGAGLGRPKVTPGWLALLGLGSFLIAVGLLAIPHDATLAESFQKAASGFAEGKRTIIAFGCLGIGFALAAIGSIIGFGRRKSVG